MKQRIITAIIALLIFIPFILYGNMPFTILIYIMAAIGLSEFMKMHQLNIVSFPALLAFALLFVMLAPLDSTIFSWFTKTEAIMLFTLILLAYTVLVKNEFTFDDAGFILISTLYVSMGFYFLLVTREAGLDYVFFILFIIWATDTGAYLFGRAFGKRKLWPQISPNKTIEGAIGGIIAACIVALVFHFIQPFPHSYIVILGATILASSFGQIGDLVESAYKRHYQVKDSGNLLPGHGGILDRFDSLLFVLPLLHFIGFIQ
ncbi:phosphatidate cytidylyltransferase [Oceanobacillus halotolerans]|uniref:phosphatidate cytidylyltransferase n=1 Tax=Oceanobacillus halotolerans TaxID=2663380 RepID=UPI0013DB1482|nr:phosphatidate cytidylyltransferase [Oceanobacillus halotolerans]